MPGLDRLRAVKRGFVFNFFICFVAPSSREREREREEKKGTRLRLRKCWREGGKKTRETEQERKVEGQSPEGGRDTERQTDRDTQKEEYKAETEGGRETRKTEQERKVEGQIPEGGRDRDSVRGRDCDAKGVLRVSTLDDDDEVELHVLGCRLT